MRRRYQKPKIRDKGGYWIAQYRDAAGVKRKTSLGPVRTTKKMEAEERLARILEPINAALAAPRQDWTFGNFVSQVYLPFYTRKWKDSTAESNRERIGFHLTPAFESRALESFERSELQELLDHKAEGGLSYSVVAHLRWDLRQIFRMAVAEGILERNPADLLFVPRSARRPKKTVMTFDQVRLFFSALELRERVIGGLAILAGMRPGEIFGLRRESLHEDHADIQQRIYRGQVGPPKTARSTRWVALGDGLLAWLRDWLSLLPGGAEGWLFPSERLVTPLAKDNCWRRHFLPRLNPVGLGWANFQVMRRTHASLQYELGADAQLRADQMGHTVSVNQNEYTRASLERRREAVNALEERLKIM